MLLHNSSTFTGARKTSEILFRLQLLPLHQPLCKAPHRTSPKCQYTSLYRTTFIHLFFKPHFFFPWYQRSFPESAKSLETNLSDKTLLYDPWSAASGSFCSHKWLQAGAVSGQDMASYICSCRAKAFYPQYFKCTHLWEMSDVFRGKTNCHRAGCLTTIFTFCLSVYYQVNTWCEVFISQRNSTCLDFQLQIFHVHDKRICLTHFISSSMERRTRQSFPCWTRKQSTALSRIKLCSHAAGSMGL